MVHQQGEKKIMATKTNIVIDQGSNYQTSINITADDGDPINLTGYTASAQLRKHFTSLSNYAFTVTITPITGIVTLSMSSSMTGSIPAGRYVYDCELISSSDITLRIVEGVATITPQVTR